MKVIDFFRGTVFILTGELAIFHCLSNSFNSNIYLPKKDSTSYVFFQKYYSISIKYSQPWVYSKVLYVFLTLKFTAIKIYQRSFFKRTLK